MNNLLFTALSIALIYYFFYYLPSQKKLSTNNPPLFTQTDPHPLKKTADCPGPIPDPEQIKKLQKDIQQKEQAIIGLNRSYEKLETQKKQELDNLKQQLKEKSTQITKLQSEIRDLAKRPSKPTNSKSTQTDELTNTLDTLIKDIQDLNNSLN